MLLLRHDILHMCSPAISQSISHKVNEAEMYTPTGGTKGHMSVGEDLHTRKQIGIVSSNIICHSPIVPYQHCSVGSHLFLIGSLFSCGFNYNICKNNIQITSLILFVSLKIQFKILNHLLEICTVYISIPITTSLDMC